MCAFYHSFQQHQVCRGVHDRDLSISPLASPILMAVDCRFPIACHNSVLYARSYRFIELQQLKASGLASEIGIILITDHKPNCATSVADVLSTLASPLPRSTQDVTIPCAGEYVYVRILYVPSHAKQTGLTKFRTFDGSVRIIDIITSVFRRLCSPCGIARNQMVCCTSFWALDSPPVRVKHGKILSHCPTILSVVIGTDAADAAAGATASTHVFSRGSTKTKRTIDLPGEWRHNCTNKNTHFLGRDVRWRKVG